jgi:melanoma-associated antigen
MPQLNRRKRRSDAISRDASPPPSESPEPEQSTQRRVRRRSSESSIASAASAGSNSPETQAGNQRNTLVKKLVRLAISTEYSRAPLRRSDISDKVFKDSTGEGTGVASSAGSFKKVFEDAQTVLRHTFGMELQELPSKERSGLNERRKQATQTQKTGSTSNRSWILVSILPKQYKEDPRILEPSHAPSQEDEAGYTAFYTLIITLIYFNNGEITEQKLERNLRRFNIGTGTPFGKWDKVKQRLLREGYLDKKKDSSGGEDVISYTVGPRGKVEVGIKGAEGLARSVYGQGAAGPGREGPKMEMDELNARLKRTLGVHAAVQEDAPAGPGSNGGSAPQSRRETPQPGAGASQQRRRGRPRVNRDDDDDD